MITSITKSGSPNIHSRSKRRTLTVLLFLLLAGIALSGCRSNHSKELLVGAAASLQPSLEELKTIYAGEHPEVDLSFTFAASGDLEEQIRQGAPIDVFFSASQKQMNSLEEDGLIVTKSREDILTNEVVLIVPTNAGTDIKGFEDMTKADIVAIGDPETVPIGQYSQEILEGLGIWDEVFAKATLGKSVTEVLSWVSAGNANAGIVYRTDASGNDTVEVAAIAPEGSYTLPVYPAAVTSDSKATVLAEEFLKFLKSDEAAGVFEAYGFGFID